MKKFVVVPMNRYSNVLPTETVASGSEKTALKQYLTKYGVPHSLIEHVTDTVVTRFQADGYNQQQILSVIDFCVDNSKNIQNGIIINKKKSNSYRLV